MIIQTDIDNKKKGSKNVLVPVVVEQDPKGYERSFDIYSRLLKDRIVFLTESIDMATANTVIAQLLFLQAEDPKKEITLYINSPGGYVTSGLAIYDTIKHLSCDVSTIVVGLAASMASIVLSGGTKGKRYALKHSQVLIHQPLISGMERSQASDLEIAAKDILKDRDTLYTILSENTGQTIEKLKKDGDRDFRLSAQESLDYGIIDKII